MPLACTRAKPFYKCINADLKEGDLRKDILDHLKHELEGIIPPFGDSKKFFLWAEIGLILPDPESKTGEKGMVWLCVPNTTTTSEIEKKYTTAVNAIIIKGSKDVFSCNQLTLKICCENLGKEAALEQLLSSPYIVLDCCSATKFSCTDTCNPGECKATKECKSICIVKELVGCKPDKINEWFIIAKEIKDTVTHAIYFPIIRPGSFFIAKLNSREKIIGAAVIFWKALPDSAEILFLRRTIVNTLWTEIGNHYDFFNFTGIRVRQLPGLLRLALKEPFSNKNGDHNDTAGTTRHEICALLAPDGTPCRENKCNGIDVCPSLDEFKGMFEWPSTANLNKDRAQFQIKNQCDLFCRMARFLELDISCILDCDKVQLPYAPSWVFLVTVKLLVEKLASSDAVPEITLTCKNQIWFLTVTFSNTQDTEKRGGREITENLGRLVSKIDNLIQDNHWGGDTSKAVVDILFGRISALDNLLLQGDIADQLKKGLLNSTTYTDYLGWEVCIKDDRLNIIFYWDKRSEE